MLMGARNIATKIGHACPSSNAASKGVATGIIMKNSVNIMVSAMGWVSVGGAPKLADAIGIANPPMPNRGHVIVTIATLDWTIGPASDCS